MVKGLLSRFRHRPKDGAVKIPATAKFPVNRKLVSRQLQEAEKHPVGNIKRLIEPQPETVQPFKPYDELLA